MTEDILLPFDLPAVRRKKVTADSGGGLISSDGGLVLLRGAERRLGLAEALAGCIQDWRDPERVVHTLPAMLRFRMFAIACRMVTAIPCCTASHTTSPTTSRCAAPRPAPKRCGASPPSTTPPV